MKKQLYFLLVFIAATTSSMERKQTPQTQFIGDFITAIQNGRWRVVDFFINKYGLSPNVSGGSTLHTALEWAIICHHEEEDGNINTYEQPLDNLPVIQLLVQGGATITPKCAELAKSPSKKKVHEYFVLLKKAKL